MANTQTITFGTSSQSSESFTFEEVGDTTVHYAGTHATLRMFPSDKTAKFTLSSGFAQITNAAQTLTKTEYLIFTQSDTSSVQYPVSKLIAAVWQGRSCGAIKLDGTSIALEQKVSGVLKITYETTYDIIDVFCPLSSMCLLEALGVTRYGYTTIDYTYGTGDGTVATTFKVRDACTGVGLPGASVWINDLYKGITDDNGFIDLGYLNPGTYKVKATKDGYQDSDKDVIANDSFTIEATS